MKKAKRTFSSFDSVFLEKKNCLKQSDMRTFIEEL